MQQTVQQNALLGVFAAQLGLVDSQQASDIVTQWARDSSISVAEMLRDRGHVEAQQLRSLESLVAEHLKRHGDDPARYLAAIGNLVPAAEAFRKIAESESSSASQARLTTTLDADPLATVASAPAEFAQAAQAPGGKSSPSSGDPYDTVADVPAQTGRQEAHDADRHQNLRVSDPKPAAADPQATVANASPKDPAATVIQPVPRYGTTQRGIGSGSAMAENFPEAVGLGSLTSSGGRFRIVREHARGGLGQLFVAEDVELNREVALKELLSHCADHTESRYRFLREAEITGALEHPGIAPVYGLGQYADGRPYYAMRFIRGDSLQDAISRFHDPAAKLEPGRRIVELRRLLRGFVSVCEAIDYAHVRGVLHRDLKPANVMLGNHGETLVVDWGLATTAELAASDSVAAERPVKPVISGSMIGEVASTLAGSALGTPAYMSPEQAEGALDRLGPATDIYGLGATLFHLLTGRPPFTDHELSIILKKVREGDFPPPKSVDNSIPPQLNAICLKAMALRPEDRYKSADFLAKDIELWLADEPVSVWAEPWHARTARWMRRHRTIVTSVAAAIAVAIVALVVGVLLLTAANERERQARNDAQLAYKTARAAVDKYYVQASENVLLNQPGMQGLRRELLGDALDYYQQFLDQHRDDSALKEEFATTHFYVGQLREDIDSPADAIPSYSTAIAMQRQLLDQLPGDISRIDSLADSLNAQGRALDRMQKHDEAFANFTEAAGMRDKLVRLAPTNDEFKRKQANTLMNLGLVEKERKDLNKAQMLYDKAQEIRESVLRQHPENTKVRRDLAKGYYNQAVAEMMQKNWAAAQPHFEEAIRAFQQVVEADSRDLMTQARLAICYRLLGDANAATSQREAAVQMYDEAETRFEQLAYHNPDVPEYRSGLAGVLMNRGNLDAKAGAVDRTESARERFKKSLDILEVLVTQHPQVETYQRDRDAVRAALQRLDPVGQSLRD